MSMDVSLLGAVLAGLVSFLSPCVLPLVPPYLAYVSGMAVGTGEGELDAAARRRIFLAAFAFVLGFMTVFVAMGATASAIGGALNAYFDYLAPVAGVLILGLGLHFLGVFKIFALYRDFRFQVERKPAGLLGAYVIGLAFAFGWTPCVGPVLAAILLVAGTEETAQRGALLLGAYAAGIGVPFLGAALAIQPFMAFFVRFRRYQGHVEKVMGAILVITGILFLTGGMSDISYWLLETFPSLGKVG